MQAYSNPKRESDPHALPDVEVFRAHYADCPECGATVQSYDCNTGDCPEDGHVVKLTETGWFWWSCFPGCLPDSEPCGPFATEAEALADAQSDAGAEEPSDDDSTCPQCGQSYAVHNDDGSCVKDGE